MLSRKRKFKKITKAEPSFLVKLYKILNESEYTSYIHWSPDGLSIIISDTIGLTKKVLPKFYNHHNYASFVRQLNMYNFHKIRNSSNSNEQIFQHDKFIKGITIDEVKNIRRKIHNYDSLEIENSINKNSTNEECLKKLITIFSNENKKENDKNNVNNIQQILSYLLLKTNENYNEQNQLKKQIELLTQQNNILMSKIEYNNQKIISQNNFYKKMKGMALFIITLIMRISQNKNLNNMTSQNTNSKNLFKNLIYKYIDLHYNNQNNFNNQNIFSNHNLNINSIKESPTQTENEEITKNNIVEKNETFSINTNSKSNESTILINLRDNLTSKKINESFCDDLSLASFPSHNFFDIDLNLTKHNSSSFNLLNVNNNISN